MLTGHPEAFKGTELDVEASRQKMEKLCARVEGFLADAAPAPAGSQALAEMLREALASNTIGGKRRRGSQVAGDGRRSAPGAGVVEPPRAGPRRQPAASSTERFHKACNRFFDQLRRKVPPTPSQPPRGTTGWGAVRQAEGSKAQAQGQKLRVTCSKNSP